MSPKPLLLDETTDVIAREHLERARNPQPQPEDEPLIADADDLHTLWCTAQASEAIAEARETLDRVEARLDALEAGDG